MTDTVPGPASVAASPATADPAAEYAAALSGAVVVWRNQEGRLRALDRDRLDLLHRMSTNDLNSLPVGRARPTVLTTPIARIVDLLWVLNRGDTALALTSPGRATAVRRWLAGYIFYNDKVKFEDASADLAQFGVFGPRAAPVAEAVLPGAGSLEADAFLEQDGVIVLRARPLAGDGFTIIAPAAQAPALWEAVLRAGAAPAGEQAHEWLRLRAGQPAAPELTDDYIPLEANLWSAVSFNKGCYIGQEIIARMESRGKLARRLVGLQFDAPVAVGAEVSGAGGSAIGAVTSAGVLPDLGPVALAYLKTAHAETGTPVRAGAAAGVVAPLPFA